MAKKQIVWAAVALFILTLAGILSIYQLLFAVWMTAYPYANTAEWQTRFYVRLVIAAGIGILWSILAIWMFRHRRISN